MIYKPPLDVQQQVAENGATHLTGRPRTGQLQVEMSRVKFFNFFIESTTCLVARQRCLALVSFRRTHSSGRMFIG